MPRTNQLNKNLRGWDPDISIFLKLSVWFQSVARVENCFRAQFCLTNLYGEVVRAKGDGKAQFPACCCFGAFPHIFYLKYFLNVMIHVSCFYLSGEGHVVLYHGKYFMWLKKSLCEWAECQEKEYNIYWVPTSPLRDNTCELINATV